jgi:hypothetical protein
MSSFTVYAGASGSNTHKVVTFSAISLFFGISLLLSEKTCFQHSAAIKSQIEPFTRSSESRNKAEIKSPLAGGYGLSVQN